jgi:hypothetical protein
MPTMKKVQYWYWLIPTPSRGGMKMVKTRYRMDVATALQNHPGVVRAPGTMELRSIPDTDDDMRANFTSAWQRSK